MSDQVAQHLSQKNDPNQNVIAAIKRRELKFPTKEEKKKQSILNTLIYFFLTTPKQQLVEIHNSSVNTIHSTHNTGFIFDDFFLRTNFSTN